MTETTLRAWIAADDAATVAESMLTEMMDMHRQRGGMLPTLAMQESTMRLRERADSLLAQLVDETAAAARSGLGPAAARPLQPSASAG